MDRHIRPDGSQLAGEESQIIVCSQRSGTGSTSQSHQQHEIILGTGDGNGQILMLSIITMKERELLLAMCFVTKGINVECQ
jgi:hypothetical protein